MVWAAVAIAAIGLIGAILGLVSLATPVPRLFFTTRRRAGLLLVAGLGIAAAAAFAPIRHHGCGCALPPIPNVHAMTMAAEMLEEGHYGSAQEAFDRLLNDGKSFDLRSAALYGRGLCKQALGDIDGAQADFAAAAAFDPPGAEAFKRFQDPVRIHMREVR